MNELFPRAVPSNEQQLVVVVRFRQSFLYVIGATLVSIGRGGIQHCPQAIVYGHDGQLLLGLWSGVLIQVAVT